MDRGWDDVSRNNAFEPFYSTKAVGEGTGLGLSVSFFIISENHGTISIESAPGGDTRFLVNLPFKRPSYNVLQLNSGKPAYRFLFSAPSSNSILVANLMNLRNKNDLRVH